MKEGVVWKVWGRWCNSSAAAGVLLHNSRLLQNMYEDPFLQYFVFTMLLCK